MTRGPNTLYREGRSIVIRKALSLISRFPPVYVSSKDTTVVPKMK
jgi:hypothetical protein